MDNERATDAEETSAPRLRLHVTPTAEWKLRSGHPWLYSESIVGQNRTGQTGELAILYDRHDNFLAIGLYDPSSPIRVRLLHKGKPRSIDAQFWKVRLQEAVERRASLFGPDTNGFRVIHGENDGWPGLVLDRYAATMVMKLYSAVWLPRLNEIVQLFVAELRPERLVLRFSRNLQSAVRGSQYRDGQIVYGPVLDDAIIFTENGLRFEADVLRGQKTGFFLDQRENRRIVQDLADGRTVLNLFSFSGGFSLYAARGGASRVVDVDISEHALESSNRNFALNAAIPSVARCQHETVKADAFDWLKATRNQFDLIVLDPPSLAKRESDREAALHAYATIAGQAFKKLKPDGILVASSCSAHVSAIDFFTIVRDAARQSGRAFKELRTTTHPADHPATFPEAQYLKTIYLAA